MQYLLRKQIILLVILLSTVFAIQAQTIDVNRPYQDEKPITLGLNIGISSGYMNFERGTAFIHPTAGQTNWISPVFNNALIMGLSGTLRLNSHFLLRVNPNILISGTKDIFNFTEFPNTTDKYKMNVASTIVNLPIALKLESDRYNFFKQPEFMRHYVFVGMKYDYDFSSSKEGNGVSLKGILQTKSYPNLLNAADFGYEAGLGISFYFPYATISPEIKFSYGLRDMRNPNAAPTILLNSLDKMTSNFVYFTIHVEGESFFLKN
jgi:hypothetical protein